MNSATENRPGAGENRLLYGLLLVVVLVAAAWLRWTGLREWDSGNVNHPDEMFLIGTTGNLQPVESLAEFFDTANSSLNPNNRGSGFYVYGTLPLFLTRYAVEWVNIPGWDDIKSMGRALSALMDLGIVLLVYLIAAPLYGRKVGLLAAAFSALAVMQIQQSHFYTTDNFANFFIYLAIFAALRVLTAAAPRGPAAFAPVWVAPEEDPEPDETGPASDAQLASFDWQRLARYGVQHAWLWFSLLFGLALGMAMASKINAAPVTFMLPAAMLVSLAGLPKRDLYRALPWAVVYLGLAALLSLVTFRCLQPYTFTGPSFWDVKINPAWLDTLRQLRIFASREVDYYPPAYQWARRPVWFALQNMLLWGLGLPLGLLAWAGFLWAGWRMLRLPGEWRRHLLLWGWTGVYFAWQGTGFNPTMRYQLPVYPSLAILAAWALVTFGRRQGWRGGGLRRDDRPAHGAGMLLDGWRPILAGLATAIVLAATFAWAFGFTRIYTRSLTRVEASQWIYRNIPGPINLHIQGESGGYNQPVPFPYGLLLRPEDPFVTAFTARANGSLAQVYLPSVVDPRQNFGAKDLLVTVLPVAGQGGPTIQSAARVEYAAQTGGQAGVQLEGPFPLLAGQTFLVQLQLAPGQTPVVLSGGLDLSYQTPGGPVQQAVSFDGTTIGADTPYTFDVTAAYEGELRAITIRLDPPAAGPGEQRLALTIAPLGQPTEQAAFATLQAPFAGQEGAGEGVTLTLDHPLDLVAGQQYSLSLYTGEGGLLALRGATVANEGDWDWGLPFRTDDYDGYNGLYPRGLDFNMYDSDTPAKLARFQRILDHSEWVTISSNRQYGSLPRLPERFPLTTTYYRSLLGCPAERSLEWCYNVAEPGRFQGELGFELVHVVQSNPTIGPLEINDQFADEAFTVYDHPKSLIFRKTADYDRERVAEILGGVDFAKIVPVKPGKAGRPADLMLPPERLAGQRAGGGWAELFSSEALYNRFPALAAVVWYLAVFLVGLSAYPLVRLALPGLPDRGYALARTAGLLGLAYLAWLGGSLGVPVTRGTLSLAVGLLVLLAAWLALRQRAELRAACADPAWRRRFLTTEAFFLAFFLAGLVVRLGNPDLWHPGMGGEKPMDFAYFNAVLKSTTFPPYDPWFSGGYLNYYYYGFVIVGMLVKWLGIVPAIAYNLILPTVFSLMATGAFAIAAALFESDERGPRRETLWVGLAAAGGMAVLGNLGTLRMIFQGYQMLVAPEGVIAGAGLLTRWAWAAQGLVMSLFGADLPYATHHWYWNPSRVIAGEAITEFPFFTFLYGDPHAHLFALPVALLALGWAVSVVLCRGRWPGRLAVAGSFLLGGLAFGALYPTNLSDIYTYLPLGMAALVYGLGWQAAPGRHPWPAAWPERVKRVLLPLAAALLLAGLAYLLYLPYRTWYGQAYSSVYLWEGERTVSNDYLTHWGLFLFVFAAWMAWETRDWLANTPLSALRRLAPYQGLLLAAPMALAASVAALMWWKVHIAWLALPLAAWAGILLLRPGLPDARRIVLFLIGTGLAITLMVEVVAVQGDLGRMNTVFKFYLQAWTLFAVAAAVALGWLWRALPLWLPGWRRAFQAVLVFLVGAAAFYPLTATPSRMRDRMAPEAPHTLNGMAYMQSASYYHNGEIDLSEDYGAIRWLQENVPGSPVVVEAQIPEYRWGSRVSIYTGLPTVLGWNWHQRQQRGLVAEAWVWERVAEIEAFYTTTDLAEAAAFLKRYDAAYIVVGGLERDVFPGPGLDKFAAGDGSLWDAVYRNGETAIYAVRR